MTASSVRIAITETRNVYAPMPEHPSELAALAERLDDVRAANVAHHVELIEAAAARGARVVGLGELFTGPYFALDRQALWLGLAEDALAGPTVRTLAEVAKARGIVVVAPLYELDSDSGRRFNTAVVIGADGSVLGRYRKSHIPCGGNETASFLETFYYERSDGRLGDFAANVSRHPLLPVFATPFARIGVAICYDRHFQGVMRTLAREGAQIVFSPAVTFGRKSRQMWRQEFAVDAMRQRLFIAGSNRRGSEPPWNVEYFGESHVVGPDGELENLSDDARLVIVDCDLAALAGGDPSGWDLARDARSEIDGPE